MLNLKCICGAVVHLGERLTGSQKVGGSNPPGSTLKLGSASAIVLALCYSYYSYKVYFSHTDIPILNQDS